MGIPASLALSLLKITIVFSHVEMDWFSTIVTVIWNKEFKMMGALTTVKLSLATYVKWMTQHIKAVASMNHKSA